MKARKFLLGLVASVMSLSVAPAMAAELEVSAGVDIVSASIWRGGVCGGPSVQPAATVGIAGFSVTAWASQEIAAMGTDKGQSELDFTVAYGVGGFSVAYTNYWWSPSVPYFTSGTHLSEVTLGYEFGESFPLAISWNTIVAGDEDKDGDDSNFSTYIDFSYPFAIGCVDCAASLAITPWEGMYSNGKSGLQVASVGLNFSKAIVETEKFTLPLFVDLSFSPVNDQAYLVAGMSFGF
ncbi:MAG: hypothetical protein SNG27_00065 [Rikenellaceae bacterium]